MKAITAQANGIGVAELPIPTPNPQEVLVRVRAAGLNRADLAMASGKSHGGVGAAGAPIGLEWGGEVVAVGSAVKGIDIGSGVMCTGGGGYAEYALADYRQALAIPKSPPDFIAAAALPIALRAMHNAIVGLGRLAQGETVLVLGAASAVGLVGLQIARIMGAGRVIGSSRDAERRARLAEFGADLAIDTGDENWPDLVMAATDGRGADLVVDLVSGPGVNLTLRATALGGRIINNGRLGGAVASFDFDLHATRRITYIGSSFRTRTLDEIAAINARMLPDVTASLIDGRLRLPIDATFPLGEAAEALARMRANEHFGKIVLTP
jgi:NADPH2:quinone reductase